MTTTMIEKPAPSEYPASAAEYVVEAPAGDIVAALAAQPEVLRQGIDGVPAERERFRYAEGKWSLREVVGHIIDFERVVGYRLFAISRGERAPLPAFNENAYVARSRFDQQRLAELARDFALARESNLAIVRRLDGEDWSATGIANGNPVSVRALTFMLAGHAQHHMAVLRDRYGVALELG
ncbi:MAG TPA: DinB family protein [Thermoanaerobaculia bacterium]|nr:DinB family protein [Thermoanaerobaculia bacterium]